MKNRSDGRTLWQLWRRYRLRWKRRYFLGRALRRRRQLTQICDKTGQISPGAILCFSTVRNEVNRLPWFLDHHRALGVDHFLIVDNASDDGSRDYLLAQPDVSLWHSDHSYKSARFGVDWLTYLHFKYGHGHWCLTLDADESWMHPDDGARDLKVLTGWLDQVGARSMGATMLEVYPKTRLSEVTYEPGTDPVQVLNWFDPGPYRSLPRPELGSSIQRGGVRERVFFAADPDKSPTLNKVPLVKWNRRFAYLTSTHVILPPELNHVDRQGQTSLPHAVLVHSKFLPEVVTKSAEPSHRNEHFSNSDLYQDYFDAIEGDPVLWSEASVEWAGPPLLCELGLMRGGDWGSDKPKPTE